MAFLTDLWESIFTPGTTPALVKATHASFAMLVVLLVTLLVMTRNLHFLGLLVIASGLWAAVTWFVAELEAEKKRQATAGAPQSKERTPEPSESATARAAAAKSPRPRRRV